MNNPTAHTVARFDGVPSETNLWHARCIRWVKKEDVGKMNPNSLNSIHCDACTLASRCPISLVPGSRQAAGHQYAKHRSHGRGERLLVEGGRPGDLRIIKAGLVGVLKVGFDGVERMIALFGRGNLLGNSKLLGPQAMISAKALTDVAVCEFPAQHLHRLISSTAEQDPCLSHISTRTMSTLIDWAHLVKVPSLARRLAMALRAIARLQAPYSTCLPRQSELAELLGATRESVNRVLRDFEDRTMVRRVTDSIVQVNVEVIDEYLSCEQDPRERKRRSIK